ncbi:BLUF domain-containing protein [Candidatus Nitrospira salsa]|nr:MAG: hypothetical protein NPIRA01_03150 [Nitrospirales bacterium]
MKGCDAPDPFETVRAMSQEDLEDTLNTLRTNKARLGITGMLLYGNHTFTQILEGEEAVVQELVNTVKRDPRHTHFTSSRTHPLNAMDMPPEPGDATSKPEMPAPTTLHESIFIGWGPWIRPSCKSRGV